MTRDEIFNVIAMASDQQSLAFAMALSALVDDENRERVMRRLELSARMLEETDKPFGAQLLRKTLIALSQLERKDAPKPR